MQDKAGAGGGGHLRLSMDLLLRHEGANGGHRRSSVISSGTLPQPIAISGRQPARFVERVLQVLSGLPPATPAFFNAVPEKESNQGPPSRKHRFGNSAVHRECQFALTWPGFVANYRHIVRIGDLSRRAFLPTVPAGQQHLPTSWLVVAERYKDQRFSPSTRACFFYSFTFGTSNAFQCAKGIRATERNLKSKSEYKPQ